MSNTPLEELMWDAHRAEGTGALTNCTVGPITDPRGEETVTISEEEKGGRLETIHNMGVANGIAAFLDQLNESGYTLLDRNGRKVEPGKHKTFGDAWKAWFRKTTPNLKVVK
jgi:hypothetical protein